jgi:hypothetical protein
VDPNNHPDPLDPHHFGNLDLDPHQDDKPDPDPIPHQIKIRIRINVMRIHNTGLHQLVVDCLQHPLLSAQEGPEPAPEDAHGGAPLPLSGLRQDVRTPGKQF